jgi:hypothetical protein
VVWKVFDGEGSPQASFCTLEAEISVYTGPELSRPPPFEGPVIGPDEFPHFVGDHVPGVYLTTVIAGTQGAEETALVDIEDFQESFAFGVQGTLGGPSPKHIQPVSLPQPVNGFPKDLSGHSSQGSRFQLSQFKIQSVDLRGVRMGHYFTS